MHTARIQLIRKAFTPQGQNSRLAFQPRGEIQEEHRSKDDILTTAWIGATRPLPNQELPPDPLVLPTPFPASVTTITLCPTTTNYGSAYAQTSFEPRTCVVASAYCPTDKARALTCRSVA